MRARHLIVLSILLLILLGIRNFDVGTETYVGMFVQISGNKPYVVLRETDTFGIYAPKGGKELEGWQAVYDNRSGKIFGTFEAPAAVSEIKDPNPEKKSGTPEKGRLGVFFESRSGVFDVPKIGKDGGAVITPHALDWLPETAATLNGKVYAFGAKLKDVEYGDELVGTMRAAKLEGAAWTEVKNAALPEIHFGKVGFWVKAVPLDGRIAVIWRGMKFDQTVGLNVEGLRTTTEGEFWLAFFDGEKFSGQPVAVKGLPIGNLSAWSEQGKLKLLLQTRNGHGEAESTGRMEIWDVAADGSAKLAETIMSEKHKIGLFPFIAAERFEWEGREYILRSTWQNFELMRKDDGGKWTVVPDGTAGLPVFTLERYLFGALSLCGMIVLFGAWLAYLRRRHALTLLHKLQPRDLYAPFAARGGAYVLDWLLVLALTAGVAHFYSEPFIDIFVSARELPYLPFLVCFLVYYTAFEWLLGATPGKFLMGLRVVMDAGKPLTFWAAFVRNLTGLYERYPYFLIVAAPMLLFSPRRQRLGDLLSRTFVVQKQGLEMFLSQRAAALERGEAPPALKDDRKRDEKKT